MAEAVTVEVAAAAAATDRMATGKKEKAWYSHVEVGGDQKTAWTFAAPIAG